MIKITDVVYPKYLKSYFIEGIREKTFLSFSNSGVCIGVGSDSTHLGFFYLWYAILRAKDQGQSPGEALLGKEITVDNLGR